MALTDAIYGHFDLAPASEGDEIDRCRRRRTRRLRGRCGGGLPTELVKVRVEVLVLGRVVPVRVRIRGRVPGRRAVPLGVWMLGMWIVPIRVRVLGGWSVPIRVRVLGKGTPLVRVRVRILRGKSGVRLGRRPVVLIGKGGGGERSGGRVAGNGERLGF